MTSEKNWSLSQFGAHIAEVSHEARHAASAASNLLVHDEQQLWIAGDVPQYVTLCITPRRPAILYAGWNVWHDYLTNPRVVEILSGESLHQMEPLTVCKAIPGSGTQIWRLPRPIPPTHIYVRFTIVETFGAGPTYMNNVILLSSTPDNRYKMYHPQATPPGSSPSLSVPALTQLGSSLTQDPPQSSSPLRPYSTTSSGEGGKGQSSMRQLLQDLNEDIRLLKPIKSISPKKNVIFSMSPPDGLMVPLPEPLSEAEEPEGYPSSSSDSAWRSRVAALEEAVRLQQEDISLLKRLLVQKGLQQKQRGPEKNETNRDAGLSALQEQLQQMRRVVEELSLKSHCLSPPPSRSRERLTIDFPEDSLRSYVTGVVDVALEKQMKRLEKKLVHRLDRYLLDVVNTITDTVEDRLSRGRCHRKKVAASKPQADPVGPSTFLHYHLPGFGVSPSPQTSPGATPGHRPPASPPSATPMQMPYFTTSVTGVTATPYGPMTWTSPALSIVKEGSVDVQSLASRQM